MTFQVWNTETANMIGSFPTIAAAYGAVREAVGAHGKEYVATWALESEDDAGGTALIAEGLALADVAGASDTGVQPAG
jgi:hypothetical protein